MTGALMGKVDDMQLAANQYNQRNEKKESKGNARNQNKLEMKNAFDRYTG